MPKCRSFAFYREQGYCGREEINLLVHACLSKLSIFSFPLLPTSQFSFLFCFTSFSSQCLPLGYVFPQKFLLLCFRIPRLSAQKGVLYRACRDWYLLFQPLAAFFWCGCPCRPLTSRQWFNHHHLPVLAVPLPSAKQKRLFCLFACYGFFYPLQCVCSLSVSIPHGIHLVVPTHHCFFWVHFIPTGHFPQKCLSKNLRIGFFPLPTARPCLLTHDPPLPILDRYRLVMPGSHACFTFFICCSCICRDLKISLILFAMHFWLLMAWVVFRSAILYDLLLLGIRPRLIIGLPSPGSFCVHSVALLAFSYYTTLLFLLTCCLTQSCWASLGLLFISLPVT